MAATDTPPTGAVRRFSLPCALDAVHRTVALARAFLAEHSVCDSDLMGCELALVEACNNAVAYAPEGNQQFSLQIQVCCDEDSIELQVIDHTKGFDWPANLKLPSPDEEHGRGLFIIQSLMDEVLYLRGGKENRLVMKKARNQPQARSADLDAEFHREVEAVELAVVEKKLELSEQVIGTMAKELCFRSEELAAIFRCTSELAQKNDVETFSNRLLNDLLHIMLADWFVLRLVSKDGTKLESANISRPELKLGPVNIAPDDQDPWQRTPVERLAAHSRKDVRFGPQLPLSEDDPLGRVQPESAGLIRPILMGDTLLGTLAVGRNALEAPFTIEQVEVIHTFSDFLAIQIVNVRMQQEQVDLRLTAHELEIARNIQQSLLPKSFPNLDGFGLSGFCYSARQVGGDFYDILPLGRESVLLVVADVMGKGVPAALFAATLHTLVRTMTEWTNRPSELMARMNRLMFEELSGVDMFITAQLAVVDTHRRSLTVASAGHCPLLVANGDGELRAVAPDGMPLGIMTDVEFVEETISLEDQCCALLYTDGLTDARNPHGEFYGQERLLQWLRDHSQRGLTATQLAEKFQTELKTFQSQVSLSDDQTFLILAQENAPAYAAQQKESALALRMPATVQLY